MRWRHCCPWPWTAAGATPFEVAQVDVVAEHGALDAAIAGYCQHHFRLQGCSSWTWGGCRYRHRGQLRDSGWALVNTSASGPMPTSRYCDHRPCSTSTLRSAPAWAEPGTICDRSAPMRLARVSRMASALAGSPLACSSTTRSSRLVAKVTPAAVHRLQVDRRQQSMADSGRAGLESLLSSSTDSATSGSSQRRGAQVGHRVGHFQQGRDSRHVGADVVDRAGFHQHHRRPLVGQPHRPTQLPLSNTLASWLSGSG